LKSKLNILFLASWYPNKLDTQNGNFIQQHARAVSKVCNVYVLHAVSRLQEQDFIVENNLNENVLEVVVYYKRRNSSLFNLVKKKKIQKQAYQIGYKEIVKQVKQIDLVHLNVIFTAGLFALFLKRKYKIPFVITEHWTGFLKINPFKINFLEQYYIKKIAKNASFICPVSDDLKKALQDFGIRGNFKVIPNVVNTEHFFLKAKKDTSQIKILHVSSLKNEHKNIFGILNVIKRVSEKRRDFKLTIIGDGDIKPILTYIKNINLEEKFIEVKHKQPLVIIAKEMQEHDFFLLFSNYENLPCVIAESLVCGLPVLSSNVGGISEMINDRNGILVERLNEEQLLSSLNFMLDNYHSYSRKAIASEAEKKYSYGTVNKQFLSIYNKALKT
jgi:glycosyltransferase involved in cell wall biosynthesis